MATSLKDIHLFTLRLDCNLGILRRFYDVIYVAVSGATNAVGRIRGRAIESKFALASVKHLGALHFVLRPSTGSLVGADEKEVYAVV